MDEVVLVEVDQGQGHVVDNIHLDMVGNWTVVALLQVAGETPIAELHQKNETVPRAWLSPGS